MTDAGELREQLNMAQRRWPDVRDRRQLLRLLVREGAAAVESSQASAEARRARAEHALRTIPALVDHDLLLGDAAWQ